MYPGAEIYGDIVQRLPAHTDLLHGRYLLLRSSDADDEEELDRSRDEIDDKM